MAGKYYWSLNDRKVVTEDDGVKAADRLGPYDSPEEASRALETVAERNESWDEEDQREE
jgi:hypothetical protein